MAEGVRYRFLSVVGEGGFGRVYRARIETDEGFNKDVAIKVLSDTSPPPSLLKRFRDEARILGLLRDRAIVSADPPIQLAGRWSVSMEFVDGASLGAMIHRKPVPPGVAVEIVSEIARALHHAFHQEGLEGQPLQLLHRDIKPENIQITPSGEVKILDFGIARANFKDREFKTRHALGGTPGYIAPERTQGIELPVGDVYSLGVVLHEAVTGIRPRYAPTVVVQNGAIDAPSEDLEVHPDHLADPDLMEVIRLAAWMRADEAEQRPLPREVEDWCRRLRQKLPPPYLREWAESEVPHRTDLPPDELIGQVVTGGVVGSPTPSGAPLTPATDHRTTLPSGDFGRTDPGAIQVGTPVSLPPSMVAPGAERSRLAMGAVLGGGVTLIAVLVIVMVALVLAVALFAIVDANRGGQTVEPPSPAPVPIAAPAEPVPAEEPGAPSPTPRVPPPRVRKEIVVDEPGSGSPPSPKPAPAPQPAPVIPAPTPAPTPAPPVSAVRTGMVFVRTIPSGGTVSADGNRLQSIGGGYSLSVGKHLLKLESPVSQETYALPVDITEGARVTVCYDFDANRTCSQ